MNRLLREFRLIPIVLVAAAALFTLKVVGLFTQGGYTLGTGSLSKSDRDIYATDNTILNQGVAARVQPEPKKKSWAQEMFFPDVTGSVSSTGATKAPTPAPKDASAETGADKKPPKPVEPKREPDGTLIQLDSKPLSAAERAILERLTERRQELEQRARELDVRETLLLEAEKRIESRTSELKDIEARIALATEKKEEADRSRLKSLVTMYESMKAKDAAKIFDRLDIKLATEVASQINPRRMSDIMAQMTPEAAERLTVELANRGGTDSKSGPSTSELPKIEGRPNGG
ncbi:MAG: flagellar protein FlbB [Pseudorhodoplanes sp.]|jgi:flagellar motility protein MotE (MotC chaperone)|nr:flagellar protein FlbB [Pseudorhodoplanes sp.]